MHGLLLWDSQNFAYGHGFSVKHFSIKRCHSVVSTIENNNITLLVLFRNFTLRSFSLRGFLLYHYWCKYCIKFLSLFIFCHYFLLISLPGEFFCKNKEGMKKPFTVISWLFNLDHVLQVRIFKIPNSYLNQLTSH